MGMANALYTGSEDYKEMFPIGTKVIWINSNNKALRAEIVSGPFRHEMDDVTDPFRIMVRYLGPNECYYNASPFIDRVGLLTESTKEN